jgi:hypothetical protein
MKKRSSIYSKIKKIGYNPSFWENNQIIKTTPLEKGVIGSFEKSGSFKILKQ